MHQVVSEHVSCLQLPLCLRRVLVEHLEEEEVLGKTGRPVSSSTVNCPHSSTPTLQLRQIICHSNILIRVWDLLWSKNKYLWKVGTCSRGKGTSRLLEKNRSITCSTNLYQSSIWKDPGAPKKANEFVLKTCSGPTLLASSPVSTLALKASLAANKPFSLKQPIDSYHIAGLNQRGFCRSPRSS